MKPTPRQAAEAFFERFPAARKVTVQEYDHHADGSTTLTVSLLAKGQHYQRWDDLTRDAALALPDERSVPKVEAAA